MGWNHIHSRPKASWQTTSFWPNQKAPTASQNAISLTQNAQFLCHVALSFLQLSRWLRNNLRAKASFMVWGRKSSSWWKEPYGIPAWSLPIRNSLKKSCWMTNSVWSSNQRNCPCNQLYCWLSCHQRFLFLVINGITKKRHIYTNYICVNTCIHTSYRLHKSVIYNQIWELWCVSTIWPIEQTWQCKQSK